MIEEMKMALKVDYDVHMKSINNPLPELKKTMEKETEKTAE